MNGLANNLYLSPYFRYLSKNRKDLMLAQSDIMVALPGGVGTLDEIFTVAASHTIALLNDLQEKGMIRGDWHDYIEVANDFEELKKKIEELA